MRRSDDRDAGRAGVIDDLPARMRRAVESLSGTDDLQSALGRLLRAIGPDSGIERLALVAAGHEPQQLAVHPSPVASLEAHETLARLVRRVTEHDEAATDPGAGAAAGPDLARARYGVPVRGDGRLLAVLVAETAPAASLRLADEVVAESVATLLVPFLLVREQLESTRELDRLRSDFIARISHELRTPLTIISGFAGTLGAHDETLTIEQRHTMLDRIVTASVRLERLIEEVLSLASMDAGLAEPRPSVVPVRDVIDLAVHDLGGSPRVVVRDVWELKVRTDPDVARVVLRALVENALQQAAAVTVVVDEAVQGVRIAVEDDGPGVPPELGPRVFERFVRGNDRSPGMGLGLAIARRMVESVGGRLWFEDVPVGARFVAELPWLAPNAGAAQSP